MKRIFTATLTAALLFLLTGCKDGKTADFTVTVRNITGAQISGITMYPENGTIDSTNRLSENLPTGSEVSISFGALTEDEISKGFAVTAYNAEDGTSGDLSQLHLKNGSKLTLYTDDWGLAAAVDMTDDEVNELYERDHADYIAAQTEAASENTDN